MFQDRVIIAKEAKRIQEFSRLQKDFFSSLQFPSALYVIIMLLKKTDSDDVIALKRLLNPLRITFSTSKERFEFIALLEMEGISSCLLSIFSSEHAESMYIFDDHVHVNQKWFRSEIEETHLGMTMTMTQKILHCIWGQAVIFMQKNPLKPRPKLHFTTHAFLYKVLFFDETIYLNPLCLWMSLK